MNSNGAVSFENNDKTKYVYQPSINLLDIWKLSIAEELITRWQNVELDLEFEDSLSILKKINEQTLSVLLTKLNSKINQLKQTKESNENLENLISWLENYFFDEIIPELRQSLQTLKAKNVENAERKISVDWSKSSPKKLTIFLENLFQTLTKDKDNLEKQRIIYLKQEASAWQQYFKLKTQLATPQSINYQNELEIIWSAIAQIFKSKLYVENCAGFGYILESLINLFEKYHNYTSRSLQLLDRVQESIQQKIFSDLIYLPLYDYLDKIDAVSQNEAIVAWLGHSIAHWGYAPVSWQQFEAKLLENSKSIAREIFQEFHDSFIE